MAKVRDTLKLANDPPGSGLSDKSVLSGLLRKKDKDKKEDKDPDDGQK